MSTVNSGPQIVKSSLAFVLDPPVSAGFIKTPKQISNCVTWFDADDLSTITTETSTRNVRFWADKSNSNLVLTGGGLTLEREPLSVLGGLNSRNTVRCDGGDYLSCPFTATYTEFTIFYVFKGDESYNSRNHILSINNGSFSSGNNNFELNINDNYGSAFQTMWVYWNGGGSPSSVIGLTSPNTKSDFLQGSPTLFTFSHTNAGSGTNTIYVNGRTRSDQVNSSTQTITIGGASHTLYLGVQLAPVTLPFKGDICEVIIYSRQLSATERSQVQNYLSNKWRIPLLQTTLTNRDLIFGKVATCQNNNIPVVDKSYRVNPANATGSPLQSNFYFNDPVSWMNSVITTTITLESWVKPNSFTFAGNDNGLGTIMIANSNFYLSIDSNGKFNAYLQGSGGAFGSHQPSTTSVTRHAWNHVVVTFDGAYIRWYLNGVLDKTSSTTFTVGTITLTNYLGIGSEGAVGYGRFLDGYVAGCKIYGKALSAAEISQNYESSKTEFSTLPSIVRTNLQLYLDADVYSSYVGSGITWTDLSGNGYNGTFVNNVTFISTEPKTLSFSSASNNAISFSSIFSFNPQTTDFSISCWIMKLVSFAGNDTYIDLLSSGATFLGLNSDSSGAVTFRSRPTGGGYTTIVTSATNLSLDTWTHITFVKSTSNTTGYIYINGVLNNSNNYSNNNVFNNSIGTVYLAYYGDNNTYNNCRIAKMMVYTTALSAEEALQNYNATKFRFGK